MRRAEFESIGLLRDHKLEFFGRAKLWKGGVASIVPKLGSDVWGCIWRVDNIFSKDLDDQETNYHRLNGWF